ncbi:MAG TPA: BMP family ABC transporter substrate-binding protein, partial [Thermomicrobiales bacterium]|nr:BMP family ABC transporter substrate-binding protein [Thermomicrobiales bacterium]
MSKPGISRRGFVGGVGALAITGALAQHGITSAVAQDASKPFKVAFIYVGPIGDLGWSYAHDQGRKELEKNVPNVETAYQESVPENPADAGRVIRDFAQKGYNLIVTTSFGYMQPTIDVAKDFPDTQFIHISGYMTADNVSTAFGKIEEPRYVAGLIAGKMTKSNKLGYVAAFPIPEVIRGCNAFTLGVRHANPEATVKVVWTNTWYDPQKERQAAEALLDGGADVIGQHQDTAGPMQAAEAAGKYGVGYDADMAPLAPKAVLTCPIWHWGVYYTDTVKKMIAGEWKSNQYWGGWQDGIVGLSPIGPMVPDDVRTMAEDEAKKFEAGDETVFTIFTGPLKDNKGKDRVKEGVAMTGDEILTMNWFVEGVEGEIPG